ncbi:MAG: hypothetical protein AAFP84_00950 [Actinomycetota bacterium]
MTERTGITRYEIELGGHASDRALRPVIDEFRIEATDAGTTRLTGGIRDSSHLNGILTHFASLNIEVIGLRRLDAGSDTELPTTPSDQEREQS